MDTPEARRKSQSGSVEDWATESLLAARAAYQDPATVQRNELDAKLGDACYERSLPVAKRRLYHGGVRLSSSLNEAFRDNGQRTIR